MKDIVKLAIAAALVLALLAGCGGRENESSPEPEAPGMSGSAQALSEPERSEPEESSAPEEESSEASSRPPAQMGRVLPFDPDEAWTVVIIPNPPIFPPCTTVDEEDIKAVTDFFEGLTLYPMAEESAESDTGEFPEAGEWGYEVRFALQGGAEVSVSLLNNERLEIARDIKALDREEAAAFDGIAGRIFMREWAMRNPDLTEKQGVLSGIDAESETPYADVVLTTEDGEQFKVSLEEAATLDLTGNRNQRLHSGDEVMLYHEGEDAPLKVWGAFVTGKAEEEEAEE